MATINIGGRVFSGRSVSIRNGVVTIDGVRQDGTLSGQVEIKITEGVLERLEADGSVTCGEVRGDVMAGGSVRCGDVGGLFRRAAPSPVATFAAASWPATRSAMVVAMTSDLTTKGCEVCGGLLTWQHDHRADNSGLDDGPTLQARKKPAPKPANEIRDIRARAWATRRQKYGQHGHR